MVDETRDDARKNDIVGSIFNDRKNVKKDKRSALFNAATNASSPAQRPAQEKKEAREGRFAKRAPHASDAFVKRIYPAGLDIGTSAIKAVELGLNRDGKLQLIKAGFQPLPGNVSAVSPRERTKLLCDEIKKFIDRYGIGKEVVTHMPSSKAHIKRVDLPPMPEDEIAKALKWEIAQGQSFEQNINDFVLEYIVLPDIPASLEQKIRLLAVAVLKKDVEEHIDMLALCGLEPEAVEINPLACAAALDHAYQFAPQDVIVFLDLGAGMTSFNVMVSNELLFSRNIYVTGDSLTKYIADANSTDIQVAERLKIEKGLSDDTSKGLVPGLENLTSDITDSFKYFSYKLTGLNIVKFDKIFLCGGPAKLGGLVPFLQDKFVSDQDNFVSGIEIANPFKRIEVPDSAERVIGNLKETAPLFTVAAGLALRKAQDETD